ncbi:MAG: chorismate mutase [Solirubrobacteraceae bacterium]|jgi:chorismate mutase|nr:chorismate mutase [Solirubrobacteraceae bacterium]
MRLHALRGATSVEADERQAILDATAELMRAVIERNALQTEDLVSCLFTATPDLHAEFPAVAARQIGLSGVPLMCAQELDVPGALPRIIRVMVHCYLAEGLEPQHVYLGEARALRLDLSGAQ